MDAPGESASLRLSQLIPIRNEPEEEEMPNNQAAIDRVSMTDEAIRVVEGPFRRFAWHLRTSGVLERTTMRIAGATVLLGAVVSVVWLATSLLGTL